MKQQHSQIINGIECVGHRDRSEIEVVVRETHKQHLHILMQKGLNTHNTHMNFSPDVPVATTITLYGLPHEINDEVVDEALATFGVVVSKFRHKHDISRL